MLGGTSNVRHLSHLLGRYIHTDHRSQPWASHWASLTKKRFHYQSFTQPCERSQLSYTIAEASRSYEPCPWQSTPLKTM